MTVQELIKELQDLAATHGDVEIIIEGTFFGQPVRGVRVHKYSQNYSDGSKKDEPYMIIYGPGD